MFEGVRRKIDGFIEYPGSVKGENGWWRLPEWLEAKLDGLMMGKRGERI